ncbi:MAG: ABC transporter permease [Dehalococcoidia bacterium]|nr:ABC transporter permease [Dehalococcoidia bacterium]
MKKYRSLLILVFLRIQGNWKLLSSVLIGTIIAGAILSSTAIYAEAIKDLGLKYALKQKDAVTLDVHVTRSTQSLTRESYQRSEENINRAVTNALEETFSGLIRSGISATFYSTPSGEKINLKDDSRNRSNLSFRSNLENHIDIIEGNWPKTNNQSSTKIPVAIGARTAEKHSINIGDSLDLYPYWDENAFPLEVVIVAKIIPKNLENRYWAGNDSAIDAPSRTWETIILHLPETAFFTTFSDKYSKIVADYNDYFTVDLNRLRANNAQRISQNLSSLSNELSSTENRTRYETDLLKVLNTYDEKLFFTQVPLFVLLLQITGIVLYYLFMVSTMLNDRQKNEIATLRSRGATTKQLITQYSLEGGCLSLIALVTGPLLAALVISSLGITPAFSGLSEGQFLNIRISKEAFLLAGLGGLLAFLTLIVPLALSTKTTIVTSKRASARPKPTPTFLKYYLDLGLIFFLILILWQLVRKNGIFSENILGERSFDPILLATPALFMITVGVVFLRIFPLLLKGIAIIVDWTNNVAATVSLRALVRNPTHYSRLVLLLMFATGVGTFGATFSATLDRSYSDRANYEVGSTIRASNLPPELTHVDSLSVDNKLLGTNPAIGLIRGNATIRAFGKSKRASILGLEPEKMKDTLYWRSDFSQSSIDDIARTLNSNLPSERIGTPIPLESKQIGVWIKARDIRGGFHVQLSIRDANGNRREFLVTYLRPQAENTSKWTFYTTSLMHERSMSGETLRDEPLVFPATLEAISFVTSSRIASGNGSVLVGPVLTTPSLMNIETTKFDNIPEDSFEKSAFQKNTMITEFYNSRYEPITGISVSSNTDVLSRSSDGPLNTEFSARIDWSAVSRPPPLHGIREKLDSQPLKAYISTNAVKELELNIGDPLTIYTFNSYHEAEFAGELNYFPTYNYAETNDDLVVLSAKRLMQNVEATLPYRAPYFSEIWISTDDIDSILTNLTELDGRINIDDVASTQLRQQSDPLVAAGWSGILAISFGAVLLLSSIGFLIYSYLSAQQRGLEFAILRTLGLSRKQIFSIALVEQAFVVITGVVLGTLVGLQTGNLMMSFMAFNEKGLPITPPFLLDVSWSEIFLVWAILGSVIIITTVGVVLVYFRLAVHKALRIGDS